MRKCWLLILVLFWAVLIGEARRRALIMGPMWQRQVRAFREHACSNEPRPALRCDVLAQTHLDQLALLFPYFVSARQRESHVVSEPGGWGGRGLACRCWWCWPAPSASCNNRSSWQLHQVWWFFAAVDGMQGDRANKPGLTGRRPLGLGS